MAGVLVRVICTGARRVERQALDLTRTARDLQASRIHLMEAADDVRLGVAERLHGPIQSQLIGIEHDLRSQHLDALADRLRGFRVDTIRGLAHQLHPMLLDVGLLPALDALLSQSPLQVTLNVSPEVTQLDDLGHGSLDPNVRRAAHAIIEESLLNAVTAAQATTVTVNLGLDGDVLAISVIDNGKGVRVPVEQGLGLRTIDAWATGLGGSWDLAPLGHGGSELQALLPTSTSST